MLEPPLASLCWERVERGLDAIRLVPWHLVHGDPAFSNVQWHDGRVIGLLDLETACVAPCDADLQPLLRMLADPLDDPGDPGPFGLPTLESFAGTFERLVEVASPLLALPGAERRLRCYAVLSELTILANALQRGVAASTLRGWAGRLRLVVNGTSYLGRVWSGEAG